MFLSGVISGVMTFFSHGSNRSAGVAVCFQKCPGKIIFHKADDDGHWLAIVLSLEKNIFHFDKCVWL